jgi:hypothetical protein
MVTEKPSRVVGGRRPDSLTSDTATASAGVRWPCRAPEPKVVGSASAAFAASLACGSNPVWRILIPFPNTWFPLLSFTPD